MKITNSPRSQFIRSSQSFSLTVLLLKAHATELYRIVNNKTLEMKHRVSMCMPMDNLRKVLINFKIEAMLRVELPAEVSEEEFSEWRFPQSRLMLVSSQVFNSEHMTTQIGASFVSIHYLQDLTQTIG